MKKIIYILATSFIMGVMSCNEDFLDTEPKDALSPGTFWKSEKDLNLALTGCYNGFESADAHFFRECGSDNGYSNFPWDGWQVIGNGTVSAANSGWNYYGFATINRCNEFIENCDNATEVKEGLRAIYKAQARFIRAYKYYILTINYGDVPLIVKNYANPDEAKVKRNPQSEILNFIEKELQEIINILPESYSGDEYGKATKGAAQALLMRYYLYFKKYDKALSTAKSITGYSLFPSFEELWDPANEQNKEVILSIQYVENLYSMYYTQYLPNSIGGWSSAIPTQSLVDAYEMIDGKTIQEAQTTGEYNPANPFVNRDPRLRASIVYPGQIFGGNVFKSIEEGDNDYYSKADNATKTGYNFKKYNTFYDLNPGSAYWNMGNDFFIFRYAEVLLTIAEAKVELNQIDDELYQALDKVRVRAGMPKVNRAKYNNQATLRNLVRNERRVEFAMEGLRRDDIIRWGIAKDVLNGDLMGCMRGKVLDTTQPNGDHDVSMTLPANKIETRTFEYPKNNLLPIPQSARDKNPELTQNDKY